MTRRHLVVALGLAALALPVLAQEDGYYGDQQQPWEDGDYGDEAPPPDEGARVDVGVDMGAAGAGVSFETFRDGLAPYGEWVTAGGYGRVWRPMRVAAGWRPYYYGRWEWTDEGWLWASDEPWGWATFHYGRWAQDPSYGWVWVPGYQWAPAWVTWRYGPEYIGWAPLAPGFSVYVSSYPFAYSWWSFVPCNRFAGVPVYSAAYTGGYVRNIFHATQPAPPRASVYGAVAPAWGGPARPFVERSVGHAIAPVRVQAVGSPGAAAAPARAGVVSVYRPDVRPAPVGHAGLAPSRPWGSPSAAAVAPGRPASPGAAAPRQGAWGGAAAQGQGGRNYAPAQRQYAPAPRQYAPAPRQYSPAPGPQYNSGPRQSYAPAQRSYAPSQQSYAPAQRSYAPAQRSYAPRAGPPAMSRPQGGGFAPRAAPQGGGAWHGGGGGGGGGGGARPAPANRR